MISYCSSSSTRLGGGGGGAEGGEHDQGHRGEQEGGGVPAFAADLVDDGHGGNCADEEDDAGDACGKKSLGTSGKTDRLEDVGSVVDDSVDTDQC